MRRAPVVLSRGVWKKRMSYAYDPTGEWINRRSLNDGLSVCWYYTAPANRLQECPTAGSSGGGTEAFSHCCLLLFEIHRATTDTAHDQVQVAVAIEIAGGGRRQARHRRCERAVALEV